MTTNTFEINRQVNLEQLGQTISEALEYHEDRDYDSVRDLILELHNMIYPNAHRILTPEEMDTYLAAAKSEEPADTEQQGLAYKLSLAAWYDKWVEMGKPNPEDLPTIPPADYLILQDDDLSRTDRTESETLELLHEVQNQILDGEREPADFLEAMELMYRISRQYTAASEQAAQRAEQAEARLVQLMQQNQHLLGVLNLISQGADSCTPQYSN